MPLEINKQTHKYYLNGIEKISVTKIISNYLGDSYFCNKQLCQDQASNCTCKNYCYFCDNVRNACIRGSAVHKVAELFIKNINKENIKQKVINTINKKNWNEEIKEYCNQILNTLDSSLKKNRKYLSEQMYTADIVAGTPDLIFKTQLDLYSIIDFKTYKTMTKELRIKTELQLTAYHWLLIKNGFKLTNKHFIVWVQKDKVEVISIEITKEKLHEWEMVLALYKEN